MPALICLDVDGTLLRRLGADDHHRAFTRVVSALDGDAAVLGDDSVPLAAIDTRGQLDVAIAHDVLERCRITGLSVAEFCRMVEQQYLELRETATGSDVVSAVGVRHTLLSLRRRGHLLAAVSGNLPLIGQRKLATAELAEIIDTSHWASTAVADRVELINDAKAAHRGRFDEVWYVGATVRDQHAAHQAQATFLAVGDEGLFTGDFPGANWVPGLGCAAGFERLPW